MDIAYDHIQEEALDPDSKRPVNSTDPTATGAETQSNLNTEFQEAFKAVQTSPWGAKLGGWFSQARKQGESFYNDLQKEATEASEQATKGFGALVSRTRGMSTTFDAEPGPQGNVPGEEAVPRGDAKEGSEKEKAVEGENEGEKPESLPADIVKEAGSLVASLRSTAAAKLKDLQKAEDAADEALLRFGTNVRNFLRDAVVISAPDDESSSKTELLFETREPGSGKKVIHTTRLDAQLHAIHTNSGSFTEDPQGEEEWKEWQEQFDAEKKTDEIAADLEKYEELRRAMEKLVPEKVGYGAFWMRYYFLRKAIEEDERKRKEVLKGASTEEEVGWDDDDDDDEDETDKSSTPQPHHKASESTTTLNAPANPDLLKPKEGRRSEEESKSVADSDASYDIVSGATSRATGSPKEAAKKADEDSDDDWE